MSAGIPIDKRPPVQGLEFGDRVAAAAIGASYRGMDRDGFARVLGAICRRLGDRYDQLPHDLVVIAVPPGRSGAVLRAIEGELRDVP